MAQAELFGTVRWGVTGRVSLTPFAPGLLIAKAVLADRFIDATSGAFSVQLQLPNLDNKWPAGIRCGVLFASAGRSWAASARAQGRRLMRRCREVV